MEEKQQTFQQLDKLERELTMKLEMLMRPVEEVKDELAAVRKTKALLARGNAPAPEQPAASSEFPMYRLRDKTQMEALVEIADYYGGTLDTGDAKEILVNAKLMRETKNTSQMVNLLINRSGAFERIRRGKYRLIASRQTKSADDHKLLEIPMHPSKPVQ